MLFIDDFEIIKDRENIERTGSDEESDEFIGEGISFEQKFYSAGTYLLHTGGGPSRHP